MGTNQFPRLHATAQHGSPLPPSISTAKKWPVSRSKFQKTVSLLHAVQFPQPWQEVVHFNLFSPIPCKRRRNQQELHRIATQQPVKSHSNQTSHQDPASVPQGNSVQIWYKKKRFYDYVILAGDRVERSHNQLLIYV